MSVYDYIIVGAGSAGCVLADELSRNPAHQVLVLESGPGDNSLLIRMPRGIGKILTPHSPYVWSYDIERSAGGSSENWLKGRAIGGSSAINGMIYARGFAGDYDQWAASGCSGWGWSTLLPHFMAHEGHELGATAERGASGPLSVSAHPRDDNGPQVRALTDAVLQAMAAAGIPTTDDTNSTPAGGAGYQPRTISGGQRCSAAQAFLHPARQRRNLTVMTKTTVQRLLFDANRRATGVEVLRDGQPQTLHCRGEIVLAAGAIESPKLLQLSGVGPAALLQQLGIAVVCDAPQVGRNLQEHYYIQTRYRVTGGSLNREFRGVRLLRNVLRYLLSHRGPMTHGAQELIAYIRTNPQLARPDCQLGVGLYTLDLSGATLQPERLPGITLGGYPMHPRSRGLLQIRAADAQSAPRIVANYLQDEHDQATAVAMLRTIRAIAAQPALARWIVSEVAPGETLQSDSELLDFYRQEGMTAYHVAGTCRMGSDAAAVVDLNTRVRGVDGVRVVDTSIFPTLPSGNTNAPVMAVAREAGRRIVAGAR
jgi:choline dehydrogenase-like flavoprotein